MEKPSTVEDAWFVLSTSNPRQAEYCLTEQNVMDDKEGREPSFRSFVPYTYIEPAAKGKEADDKLSLRAALRRYFFVQGDEKRLETVIRLSNANHEDKAFFLRNGTKKKAVISQADMQKLIDACSDNDASFDLPVSLDDIKVGNTFNLAHTPFESKDARYTIVSVHKKKDGSVQIQLELTMFNVTFRRLFVTYNETVDTKRHAELVTTTQKKLLDILKRKVNGKETEVSRYLDEKTLRDIFAKRSLPIADGPMRRHFLALMLICAQLLRDAKGKADIMRQATEQLEIIDQKRESKAATDTRAYLHIALYIATKKSEYREMARDYVRKYDPKSQCLRQFVSTATKREARKFFGQF